jgi:hypothetical protein
MEFSVGNALGTSFRVWFRNFIPFTLLSVAIHLPILIWLGSILSGDLTPDRVERMQTYGQYAGMLGVVLNILLTSTMIYGVVMELRGNRASVGASIGVGLSRFFATIGVTILTVLAVLGGFIALIIPGFIVLCMLYVSVPASVIERPGVTGALKRSAELTKGYRGQIFGLILIVGVLSYGAGKVIENVFLDPIRHEVLGPDQIMSHLRKYAIADAFREVLLSTLGAVLTAVTYFQLRQTKEGSTAEEMARVFD